MNKNLEKRIEMMQEGLAELENWLEDAANQGLADLQQQPDTYWETVAARLVDLKLSGPARRLRYLQHRRLTSSWQNDFLQTIAQLHLFVRSFQQLGQLPQGLQYDLLQYGGVNLKKTDVLEEFPATDDHWLVLAQVFGKEEQLRVRSTWLWGESSQRAALLLDFAWGSADFEGNWVVGSAVAAKLVYYPSAVPIRALATSIQPINRPFKQIKGFPTLDSFLDQFALDLKANPWLSDYPVALSDVIPVYQDQAFYLLDRQQKGISFSSIDALQGWNLVALSAGKPLLIFGLWKNQQVQPLTAISRQRIISL